MMMKGNDEGSKRDEATLGVDCAGLAMARRLCRGGGGGFVGHVQHGGERRGEIGEPRAGDDHGVAPAVSGLGDAQEPPALIFPKFDAEVLAFDLHLF